MDMADMVRRVSPEPFLLFFGLLISNRLSLPDLTPNPGLWWYFFTEMFDHFRPFFLAAFSVL